MITNKIKYLASLMLVLGVFLTSCTETTEPVADSSSTEIMQKIEYTPTADEALDQAEDLLLQSLKTSFEPFAGLQYMDGNSTLGKSNSNSTYNFISGWHTWRGELDESPFDIEDSYNAEYLAKIQFQDGTSAPQFMPEGAQYMLMYLNSHAAFGFIGNDPSGDEVWYDLDMTANSLNGNPSVISGEAKYERRWVGLYSTDDENYVMTEITSEIELVMNDLKFYYDWNADDYYLDGGITVHINGYKVFFSFSNSRIGSLQVTYNGFPVRSSQVVLPNFYEMYNIPSLESWSYGASFEFPALVPFGF